jgi:exoribonuclease II
MADIHELREELLEEAMEYLDTKFRTHKKFAKLFFEHKLKQGVPIDSYTTYMPQIYTPQEAIDLAKAMEAYVVSGNGK